MKLHIMLSAAVPILPHYAFMACAETASPSLSRDVKMKFPLFLKLNNLHLEPV
jgi:hypothetical protein